MDSDTVPDDKISSEAPSDDQPTAALEPLASPGVAAAEPSGIPSGSDSSGAHYALNGEPPNLSDSQAVLTPAQKKQLALARGSETAMDWVYSCRGRGWGVKVVTIDVEVAGASEKITEIGMVVADVQAGKQQNLHYIVDENKDLFAFGQDPAARQRFIHGESVTLPLSDVVDRVNCILASMLEAGIGLLVGHAAGNDVKWLTSAGIAVQHLPIYDTDAMHKAYLGHPGSTKLEKLGIHYGVECAGDMHNAGNDAWLTWNVLQAQWKRRFCSFLVDPDVRP
jgi:hypothetical protein